jgi:hypothetical protein
MVRYYTYRLKEEQEDYTQIMIQEVPTTLSNGDVFLVFLAGTLDVLGIYKKKSDYLIIDKKIEGKKLSDFYSCFGCVGFVNERTYKMFAKRVKEIEKEDVKKILKLT